VSLSGTHDTGVTRSVLSSRRDLTFHETSLDIARVAASPVEMPRSHRERGPTRLLSHRPRSRATTNPVSTRAYETSETRKAQHFIERKACDSRRRDERHTREIASLQAGQPKDAHSIICIRRIRSPRALCVRKMDATAERSRESVVTPTKVRQDTRSFPLASVKEEDGASACVISGRNVIGP
jgi:hypothetical protein